MIIRVSKGFKVYSNEGKNLGTYETLSEAKQKLAEQEYSEKKFS